MKLTDYLTYVTLSLSSKILCKEWSDIMGCIRKGTELSEDLTWRPQFLRASDEDTVKKKKKKNKARWGATGRHAVLHVRQFSRKHSRTYRVFPQEVQGFSIRNMVFFHRKIAVQVEIKQNSDWLRPCCPNGHTPISVSKRGCSGPWTSGQFGIFMDFVCVWSRSFCRQIKVLLHSALKTPGDFLIFEIFWTNWEKRSRLHDRMIWS